MDKGSKKEKNIKREKNINIPTIIIVIVSLIVGGILGYLTSDGLHSDNTVNDVSFLDSILPTLVTILCAVISYYVQIIIHEGGHLVFGLLSGYKFQSFRIRSLMITIDNGKLKFKRFKLTGTDGQCLMCPPDLVDGKLPVTLYNFGGAIMNFISSLIFGLLFFLFKDNYIAISFFLPLTFFGLAFAFINAFPVHTKNIDNDGYNAISLRKNKEAMYAFWLQLKINALNTEGIRLKDMNKDWFRFPKDEDLNNSITATIAVFTCNYLMDCHEFKEAAEHIKYYLERETAMAGIYRYLLTCDYMYIELISKNRHDIIDDLVTNDFLKFIHSMSNYPSIIRTKYVYSLFYDHDKKKADIYLKRFEKVSKTYPYKTDIASEKELMEIAKSKAIDTKICKEL